jgi:hypothetical protein
MSHFVPSAMSSLVKIDAPVELLFRPVDEKKNACVNREAKLTRPGPICKSELQWWAPPGRVTTPKLVVLEKFVLLLFLVVTVVAITSCFVELSQLLDGDALRHVAAKAIKGGA